MVKLFLIVALFSFSENDPIKIRWEASNKLTWEDFQGKPDVRSGYVATTNSGIFFTYSYSVKKDKVNLDFEVHSYFYPKNSWYIPSEVDQNILNHEQTHFDISELHARILHKKISESIFSKKIKKEIEAMYKEVEISRREMQNNFDKETDHSKNKKQEIAWELFVKKELEKYESK